MLNGLSPLSGAWRGVVALVPRRRTPSGPASGWTARAAVRATRVPYRRVNHGIERTTTVTAIRLLSWPCHAPPARTHPANMPDKDEAAGSSPARPTNRPVTSGNAGRYVLSVPAQSDASRWDEAWRALALLSRNNASEQSLCSPTAVRMPWRSAAQRWQNPSSLPGSLARPRSWRQQFGKCQHTLATAH